MRLFTLVKNIRCRIFGSSLVDIKSLHHNHSDVKEDGIFFCIDGEKSNGTEYVNEAIKLGAVAIVVKSEIFGLKNITQVIVKDVRKTMSLMACNFYNNPAKKLKVIGVTGTNGKTTTTHMLSGLLNGLGKKSAIIGTNGIRYFDKKIDTGMTTPDPIELQKIFFEFVKAGIEYVCMEVSAHAIFYNKLDGFIFEMIIFTNLTEDHLDFFKSMEEYFNAKKKIFETSHTKIALINIDDNYGKKLFNSINIPKYTYSIYRDSNFRASILVYKNYNQWFYYNNQKLKSKFLGEFNVYNLLSAISCIDLLGVQVKNLQEIIDLLEEVDGRVNKIVIKNKLFIIDYAHTPDGLENILKLCLELKMDKKLISVFGCGGNRETQKRSKMGEISSKYADLTIITADNPRNEPLEIILNDIEKGCVNNNYVVIKDRTEAIKYADKFSKSGDIILIAGKGAENYMEINGRKIPYSDFDEIKKLEKIDD